MMKRTAAHVLVLFFAALLTGGTGTALGQAKPSLPSTEDMRTLTLSTLLSFNDAVKAKDFSALHNAACTPFRRQFTPVKLQAAFQAFVDRQVDISGIRHVTPIYDPAPAIDGEGALVLKGKYPTRPNALFFSLRFLKEGGRWRMLGINVNIKPAAEEPALPAAPTMPATAGAPPANDPALNALVTNTLLAFNAAVKAGEFSAFREGGSTMLRKNVSVEKLQAAFQAFIDRKIDVSGVRGMTPAFTPPPSINPAGHLALTGHYETRPNRLLFSLTYIAEGGLWRLLGMNVSLQPVQETPPPAAHGTTGNGATPTPATEPIDRLTRDTLLAFNDAVKAGDFTAFHASVSKKLQQEASPAKFRQAFQGFIANKIDFGAIRNMSPIYSAPPHMDAQDTLVVSGFFPTTPNRVVFGLKFIEENGAPKLLWLNVQVTQDELSFAVRNEPPSPEVISALTLRTLLAFNAAVKAGDFSAFHSTLSHSFSSRMSAENLKLAFSDLIKKQVDIGGIREQPVVFDEAPAVNAKGLLVLQGHYPLVPKPVRFHLTFTYEHPAWKLVAIKVDAE